MALNEDVMLWTVLIVSDIVLIELDHNMHIMHGHEVCYDSNQQFTMTIIVTSCDKFCIKSKPCSLLNCSDE